MFEIIGILLCVGTVNTPQESPFCMAADDTYGPYRSETTCAIRLGEIKRDWPPFFAKQTNQPEVTMFFPEGVCDPKA